MEKKAKITFHGGTGSVTGANFLLEIDGKKILVEPLFRQFLYSSST